MNVFKNARQWLVWIRNNGVAQTFIGFISFLIIAAVVMLFLESAEDNSGIKDLFNSLWFSIVTVTTVGYGDLSPISSLGKIAAVVIMFIGILYIGVLTGNITSWLVERNRRKVLGLVPVKKVEGHFLILGWRQGMGELLKDILILHDLDSSYIVLVNNIEAQEVNELRQDPLLKNIQYYRGDYTNTEVLQYACGNTAEKVLILSSEISGLSADEIDFRTVLATIAVKRINPKIYAIVEIIQPKFDIYLQHVDVEEIILNRLSARAIMTTTALMSGLTNVFTNLFALDKGILKIKQIDSEWTGKTYFDLKMTIEDSLVVGLIENTGNLRHTKQNKMNQIQKSVSIKKAITDLIDIKHMQSNVPIIHPAPNYQIKENSSLIVLECDPGDMNKYGMSTDTILEHTGEDVPIEATLSDFLSKSISVSKNWNELNNNVVKVNIEFYQYRNQINGIIFKNQKFPFKSLMLKEREQEKIRRLFESKESNIDVLRSKLNLLIEKSEDWEHFYQLLKQNEFDFYLYRKSINGVIEEGKKISFKSLGFSEEFKSELNSHLQMNSENKVSAKPKTKKSAYSNISQFLEELKRQKISFKKGEDDLPKTLFICGWKPQLLEMLKSVISQYPKHNPKWNKLVVVADVPDETAASLRSSFGKNIDFEMQQGDIVNREILKKAGIKHALKVIILAETDSGKTAEEIDSQTVLCSMLIGSLNKKAYKVAEILDKRYKESLEQANTEEIFLEDEFSKIMLSNGCHGLGVTHVISEMVNQDKTSFRIKQIEDSHINESYKQFVKKTVLPNELIIGLLEDSGNINARKSERIYQAQIQSNIGEQVNELIKVKSLIPNHVVVAPSWEYKIAPNTKAIILKSTDEKGWKSYQEFQS